MVPTIVIWVRHIAKDIISHSAMSTINKACHPYDLSYRACRKRPLLSNPWSLITIRFPTQPQYITKRIKSWGRIWYHIVCPYLFAVQKIQACACLISPTAMACWAINLARSRLHPSRTPYTRKSYKSNESGTSKHDVAKSTYRTAKADNIILSKK